MLSNAEWIAALRPGDCVGWGAYRAWQVRDSSPQGDWLTIYRHDCNEQTLRNAKLLAKIRADSDTQNRIPPIPIPQLGPSTRPAARKPQPVQPAATPARVRNRRKPAPPPPPASDFQLPPPLRADHDRITACVYRLYDAADKLIYVGSAYDPHERLKEHRKRQAWWPRVSRATYEWHPDRILADLAEHTAIVYESPEVNLSGAHPHYKYRRSPYVRTAGPA